MKIRFSHPDRLSLRRLTPLAKVAHHQMTSKRKDMLKLALSKDYLNFCEQDHSGLIYLFGSDFAESSKRAEATD